MATDEDVTSPVFDSPGAAAVAAAGIPTSKKARRRRRLKKAALLAIVAIIALILWLLLRGEDSLPGISSQLPHYERSFYGAVQPMGVAVSPDGDRVYVSETGGRRLVRVYDPSGEQVDALKPPGARGKRRLPVYVAVDPERGDVYVSDRLDESIHVYGEDGKLERTLRPRGRLGRDANPLGLAFGPEGDLYVTDVNGGRGTHKVLVFDPDRGKAQGEKPLRRLGRPGLFWFPNGIAVDSDGDVFVADSNNGRLAIFGPDGKPAAAVHRGVAEGDLGLPRGVAIDDDLLYVVDTTSHAVKVYELGEEAVPDFVGSFGVEGIDDGAFLYPNGVATDGDGRIYVTDRENNRVQVWTR